MEKPNAAIIVKVPISDSGMAMTGISTERGEPRNRNTTTVTIISAWTRVLITSLIALFTKVRRIVDDLAGHALGQLRHGSRERPRARP